MPVSEEDQMKAMLEAMGVDTLDDLPPPAAEVSESIAQSEQASAPVQVEEVPVELPPIAPRAPTPNLEPTFSVPSFSSAGSAEMERPRAGAGARDVSASTIVHLMGLATSQQLNVIESRIDVIASKMASLFAKMERMEERVAEVYGDTYLDRIDFQLSEMRQLMKKVFPKAMASGELETDSETALKRPR